MFEFFQSGEEEKERDCRGFKEIYLGKGKFKGIYGDLVKEKFNYLIFKVFFLEDINVYLLSLIFDYLVVKFELEIFI